MPCWRRVPRSGARAQGLTFPSVVPYLRPMPTPTSKRPPYLLAGSEFSTKDAIKQHVRRIRARMSNGEKLVDSVTLALLETHPEWQSKTQDMVRIVAGTVIVHDAIPSKAFMVETSSGDLIDITWAGLVPALERGGGVKPRDWLKEHLDSVRSAARAAICPDVVALHRGPGYQVDHAPPKTFDVLLHDFLSSAGKRVREIKVADPPGGALMRRWVDADLEERWRHFHRQEADLRVLTLAEHAKVPKVRVDWESLL